jgi:DNA-binding transcriptional LysR family regulator
VEVSTLRTFIEVMRRGSFAIVARDQNVDPSSVSRAISTLEQDLGVRLFHRTTRKLAPTEAAEAYFERLEPIIEELEHATLAATDASAGPRGLLRLTAPITFAQEHIVPLLPELARRHPDLRFELLLTDAYLDLVAERVDVAIRLGRLADSSLVAHRLCDMPYAVAASPDYLQRRGRPSHPAELAQHACLRYPVQGYGSSWQFREGDGEPFEVQVAGPVVAANGAVLRHCAIAGMGILLVPRWNIAAAIAAGELIELFPDHAATVSELGGAAWLVYPSRSYLPLKVRVFVDYLRAQFAAAAPPERALRPPAPGRSDAT